MATTSVEICNSALALIGARRIVALTDTSKEGRTCNDNYDPCRKSVLRMHPWNFASDREVLEAQDVEDAISGTAGVVRIKITAHGFVTGNSVTVADIVGTTEANATWTITRVDANYFELDGSTFATAYVSGGVAALAPEFGYDFKYALPTDFIRVIEVLDENESVLVDGEYLVEGGYLLTDQTLVHLRYVKNLETTTAFDPLFDDALATYLGHKICVKLSGSEELKDRLMQDLSKILQRARFTDSVENPSKQLDSDEWGRARWDENGGFVRDPMT